MWPLAHTTTSPAPTRWHVYFLPVQFPSNSEQLQEVAPCAAHVPGRLSLTPVRCTGYPLSAHVAFEVFTRTSCAYNAGAPVCFTQQAVTPSEEALWMACFVARALTPAHDMK